MDDLDQGRRRRHTLVWLGGLSLVLVGTVVVAVGIGPVTIGPATVAQIVGHHVLGWPDVVTWRGTDDTIVWLVRLPRVVLGAVVGAALAVTGMVLQAMVRNVLADPYILGVTSGASTGAAAAILFGVGVGLGGLGISALSVSAFLGALGAMVVVFLIARSGGKVTSVRLLLAGIAVGYALYSATSFLIFASDSPEGARSVLFWLLGSLALAGWSGSLAIACVVVTVALAVLTIRGRHLDALAIGDETAHTLGVSPARFRVQLLVIVALCVGAVVAVSGGIGFVGLVVPHVARKVIGGAHKRAVPVGALIGAIFLVWADVVARTAVAPQELPIGIVTGLIGAPFLLVLVRRFHAATT
ncbi:MAG: iron ABC transporter permease [Actinomycetota bacterium]|nr:iron ABC transporter permease [Actinomycetota bacterium]